MTARRAPRRVPAQDSGSAGPAPDWFRALIEAAPDVYFRYSFHPERRFAYVSPAIAAATGHAPEAFQSDPGLCLRLVVREDRAVLRQVARARRPLAVRLRLVRGDGLPAVLELRTVPVVRNGRVLAIEGVARPASAGQDFRSADILLGEGTAGAEPVQQRLAALMYEVHDLLHRVLPPAPKRASTELRAGDVALDVQRMAVTVGGHPVAITGRELLVLKYFLEHPGRLVTRQQLLTDVWNYSYTGDARTVDVHISRLRRKLPPLRRLLVAVKHLGYRLEADEAQAVTA